MSEIRKIRLIKPAPLTAKNFAPYGDVIEVSNRAEPRTINQGNTLRYHDLARLELMAEGGRPSINIFRSKPLPRPVMIRLMERHPLSSQVFFPLGEQPYLVVVAKPGDFHPKHIRAFLAGADQGVNFHPGVWHHYSLALNEPSDFLVIDRLGPGEDCEEAFLEENKLISIDY